MNDSLTALADQILDVLASEPGTTQVIEVGGETPILTRDEADRFVEVVKTHAMERAMTVNAWLGDEPDGARVTVQHLASK